MRQKDHSQTVAAAQEAFASRVREFIDERCSGSQTKAAKRLGVSQPHLSAIMLGARGPGLATLLLLRRHTGMTIDALLGLEPPEDPEALRLLEEIEQHEAQMKLAEQRLEALRAKKR